MFENISYGKKIAQRLGHLFFVNAHKTVMDPVINVFMPGACFTLCDFILMVRKLQILATAMDIKMRAQLCR